MKISAVIPTKNRPQDLMKAVESVISQKRLPDELVIIDQSDSNSAEFEVQALVTSRCNSLNLRYVYDPSIKGLVDAKRVAVSASFSDVVCFLEDDVVLEPEYIRAMEGLFDTHPDVMGCCGIVTNLPDLPANYQCFFHLFHRGIFHDPRVGVHGGNNHVQGSLVPSNYLSGGTSAYRRVVFEKVPFDLANNFFMLEDIDFSTRAVATFGEDRFFINTSARLAHMMSPLNRARLYPRYRKKLREFICFYKKNKTGNYALLSLFWLLLGMCIEATVVSVKTMNVGPLTGTMRGIVDGVAWKIIQI